MHCPYRDIASYKSFSARLIFSRPRCFWQAREEQGLAPFSWSTVRDAASSFHPLIPRVSSLKPGPSMQLQAELTAHAVQPGTLAWICMTRYYFQDLMDLFDWVDSLSRVNYFYMYNMQQLHSGASIQQALWNTQTHTKNKWLCHLWSRSWSVHGPSSHAILHYFSFLLSFSKTSQNKGHSLPWSNCTIWNSHLFLHTYQLHKFESKRSVPKDLLPLFCTAK